MAYMNQFSESNGTTVVTILAAPAASTTRTVGAGYINIANLNNVSTVITMQANVGGTVTVLEPAITIPVNDSWSNAKNVYCLDLHNQTLEIYLSEVATTELDVAVMYRDEAQ